MKKIFTKLMLLAVAAAALVSCENKFDEQTPSVELTQTVTLSAEKPTEVRTELRGLEAYWSPEDQIGVYVKDGDTYKNYAFDNDNEEATLTTSFTGTTAIANTLYVYYPYVAGSDVINDSGVVKANIPSIQQPTVASFDGAADIMIAKPVTLDEAGTQLSDLEFARVGAIVKIVLIDNTTDKLLNGQHIKSLTMTAESNLAGKVYLDAINQELGTLYDDTSRSTSVTANYTTATQFEVNENNAVYLVVYPQTLATGSKLTIEASTEEYTISREITLSQDIILPMGTAKGLKVSLDDTNVEEIKTIEWVDNAYNLVPNITGLAIGDKVVIAAADYDMALSTTQNTNNRQAVAITKNANNTIDFDYNVEVLTVEAGNVDGTFAFKTSDNKYLYAASSSSNHLRSEATLSNNSSFLVTIADGIVTATAQGTNTRNMLRYNNGNTPPIFSCYGSGQMDISIYKLVGEYDVKVPAITLSIDDVTVEHNATSGEATVNATNGDGWTINATTDATWVSNLAYADGKITFTTEANDGDARTATVNVTATNADYEDVTTTFTISQKAKPAEGGATENTVTHDFTEISFTGWTNSYAAHTVEYDEATVTFEAASKQTGTITNMPVTKGKYVALVAKNGATIKSAKFVCKQWSSKTQTITLHYSTNGGTSYTSTNVTSSNFTISKDNLPEGTNAVKITFSSSSNQIGVESATITYVSGSEGGETPETPAPELAITTTSPIAVGAEGDVATVAYTITNPVEGKSVTASADQTWVNGFDYTVAGEVSFTVDANTGAAREATVTLAYDGAESKTIKVSQAAGNTGGGDEPGTSEVFTLLGTDFGAQNGYTTSEASITSKTDASIWKVWGWMKSSATATAIQFGAKTKNYILTPACTNDIATVTLTCSGSYTVALWDPSTDQLITGMVKKNTTSGTAGNGTLTFTLPAGYKQVKIISTRTEAGTGITGSNAATYIQKIVVTSK